MFSEEEEYEEISIYWVPCHIAGLRSLEPEAVAVPFTRNSL